MTIASNPGASHPAEVGIPNFPVTTVGAAPACSSSTA